MTECATAAFERQRGSPTPETISLCTHSSTVTAKRAGEMLRYSTKRKLPSTPLTHLRINLAPIFAECLGTTLFVLLGAGANLTSTIDIGSSQTSWLRSAFGCGFGLMLGICVTGGISGSILNPAVGLVFALYRQLPWILVPVYILAEFIGAFIGAILAYICFAHSLDTFDNGNRQISGPYATAGVFGSFPRPFITNGAAFLSQSIGSGLLVLGIFAITDPTNFPSRSTTPIAVGLLLTGIAIGMGYPAGFPYNAALDLGSRCAAAIWYGKNVFTFHHSYTWVPVVASFAGALGGASAYQLFMVSRRSLIIRRVHGDDSIHESVHNVSSLAS
ncbi:glycerol channel [Coemansia sp. RSA 485]|nr:glycerol channel [Coemansia sp. RSA 485]